MARMGSQEGSGTREEAIMYIHYSPGRDCGKSRHYHHPNQEIHLNKLIMRHINTNVIVFP